MDVPVTGLDFEEQCLVHNPSCVRASDGQWRRVCPVCRTVIEPGNEPRHLAACAQRDQRGG